MAKLTAEERRPEGRSLCRQNIVQSKRIGRLIIYGGSVKSLAIRYRRDDLCAVLRIQTGRDGARPSVCVMSTVQSVQVSETILQRVFVIRRVICGAYDNRRVY